MHLIIFLLLATVETSMTNRKSLKILAIYYSDDGNETAPVCNRAMRLAIDTFNRNYNLLPDYHIEIVFQKPQGTYGQSIARKFIDFFDSGKIENSTMLSPIYIGPSEHCGSIQQLTRHFKTFQFSPG